MQYKPNQRVAYYEVTGLSDPSPAKDLEIGNILVDRPRGPVTQWNFLNFETGTDSGWIAGKRIGFARVDPTTMKPVPEPKLQVILDAKREALKETQK